MPTTKREPVYEAYASATNEHLAKQKELLLVLAADTELTDHTRDLASWEAAYVETLLTFRQLPHNERRQLIRNDIAPWYGNWSCDDQ